MFRRATKSLLALGLGAGFAITTGSAVAQDECNPEFEECPPPPVGICHNIGGPMELGANCDGATGTCEVLLDTGAVLVVPSDHFLGIVIPLPARGAIAAHIAHGDGPIELEFIPALHLASTGQIHQASNVECLGERVLPQPPEPGN